MRKRQRKQGIKLLQLISYKLFEQSKDWGGGFCWRELVWVTTHASLGLFFFCKKNETLSPFRAILVKTKHNSPSSA